MGLVSLSVLDLDDLDCDIAGGKMAAKELHEHSNMQAFDVQSGEALEPGLVRKARMEEMESV